MNSGFQDEPGQLSDPPHLPPLHCVEVIDVGNVLTVAQHMKTMMKVPMTPPIPTNQVILRKRITPKMFWIHGR